MSFADAFLEKFKVSVKTAVVGAMLSISVMNVIDFVILAKNSTWKKK